MTYDGLGSLRVFDVRVLYVRGGRTHVPHSNSSPHSMDTRFSMGLL